MSAAKTKSATRKQLITWLAWAMEHLPTNLCEFGPGGEIFWPPRWVKEAKAELERNGITFVAVPKKKRKKR